MPGAVNRCKIKAQWAFCAGSMVALGVAQAFAQSSPTGAPAAIVPAVAAPLSGNSATLTKPADSDLSWGDPTFYLDENGVTPLMEVRVTAGSKSKVRVDPRGIDFINKQREVERLGLKKILSSQNSNNLLVQREYVFVFRVEEGLYQIPFILQTGDEGSKRPVRISVVVTPEKISELKTRHEQMLRQKRSELQLTYGYQSSSYGLTSAEAGTDLKFSYQGLTDWNLNYGWRTASGRFLFSQIHFSSLGFKSSAEVEAATGQAYWGEARLQWLFPVISNWGYSVGGQVGLIPFIERESDSRSRAAVKTAIGEAFVGGVNYGFERGRWSYRGSLGLNLWIPLQKQIQVSPHFEIRYVQMYNLQRRDFIGAWAGIDELSTNLENEDPLLMAPSKSTSRLTRFLFGLILSRSW